jgi:hypothetical protein
MCGRGGREIERRGRGDSRMCGKGRAKIGEFIATARCGERGRENRLR